MGDTGCPWRSSVAAARQCPPTGLDRRIAPMPRLAVYALIVCLLAVAAAVVSFAQGSFLGIIWVLLAGLSSNMCWYYVKRRKVTS
ncbi:hypothetical protein [Streptomyces sp. TLI_55]|uniref:hypothetical protein n=1 Tax=Streptomyces sp. TLI_55 TaxID=1938861 RepID=UPI00211CA8C1|nr:hypothetical protein [Streptomyces sp. TLI_55]